MEPGTNERCLDEPKMSAYPDLDYTPSFPWLGQSSTGHDVHHADPNTQREDAIVHQDFVPEAPVRFAGAVPSSFSEIESFVTPPAGFEASAFGIDVFGNQKHTVRKLRHISSDPDFHSGDDSDISDELISEANSDSHSPRGSTSAVRGERGTGGGRSYGRGRRGRGRGGKSGRGGKGIKRGLRKPLEPTPEFKMLHSEATTAFIEREYDKAEELTQQAILVNPEMFPAHSLLSEIHMARGDKDKALTALFHGAHTRPRDAQVWSKVALLILERAGDDRVSGLKDAIYCYNRIIGADATNVDARYQRASLNRELGYKGKAAYEYERLLKQLPHNTTVLRHLAEIYIELGEVERAKQHYDESIEHYQARESTENTAFTWSDLNIYAELFSYLGHYEDGIMRIKSLSRWLLGRRQDDFWEYLNEDDREWDANDEPRRSQVNGFLPGSYGPTAYGEALPLELRIKLGIYRLRSNQGNLTEALNHFEWLDPDDDLPTAKLFDYPDLFREAADALRLMGNHNESLRFYEPLQQLRDYTDASFFMDMAVCYKALSLSAEAEDCYQTVIHNDNDNIEARVQLAKMYEELGMSERAVVYVNEVIAMGRGEVSSKAPKRSKRPKTVAATVTEPSAPTTSVPTRQQPHSSAGRKEEAEEVKEERFHMLYSQMQGLSEGLRLGDEQATTDWMKLAKILILEFRSNKVFYPFDKYMRFFGYSKEARMKALKPKASQAAEEMEAMAGRLHVSTGQVHIGGKDMFIPDDYRSIPFHKWLDISLQYALLLAQNGDVESSYETMSAVSDANVFYHSPDSMFLIHVCWFTCALIASDEGTLCNVARWFMKEFQFVTDGYRLYSTLNRVCDSPKSWYNSGPSQKYILRQVKAMDFSLIGEDRRKSLFHDKASYTTKDEKGNQIRAREMDVALLVLYGHILYAGTSYSYALNYFFRAYALDPRNPMINLSLALGYIHHAIKRQSENRHYLIMQGFSFLFIYHDIRQGSQRVTERQEADYNVARAFHLLGLTHLAIPYYEQCLVLSELLPKSTPGSSEEDFALEAAAALQGIWATSGETVMARAVTEKWLVI